MAGVDGDSRELTDSLRTLVRSLLPELLQIASPVRARVVRVHESAGSESEEQARYSADVQPLRPDGSDDGDWPEIPRVDLPVAWAGADVGVYATPAVGTVVRVGFEYGDRNRPFIVGLLGLGADVPEHAVGDLVVKAGAAVVRIRRSGAGRVEVEADEVRVKAGTKVVLEGQSELGGEGGKQLVTADLVCPYTGLAHGLVPPTGPGLPPTPAPGVTSKVRAL